MTKQWYSRVETRRRCAGMVQQYGLGYIYENIENSKFELITKITAHIRCKRKHERTAFSRPTHEIRTAGLSPEPACRAKSRVSNPVLKRSFQARCSGAARPRLPRVHAQWAARLPATCSLPTSARPTGLKLTLACK